MIVGHCLYKQVLQLGVICVLMPSFGTQLSNGNVECGTT